MKKLDLIIDINEQYDWIMPEDPTEEFMEELELEIVPFINSHRDIKEGSGRTIEYWRLLIDQIISPDLVPIADKRLILTISSFTDKDLIESMNSWIIDSIQCGNLSGEQNGIKWKISGLVL